MHERSLANALLSQISGIASSYPTSRVSGIRISIGRFSGVEPDLFRMALEEMLPESPCRGAEIDMKVVEIEALCPQCEHQFPVTAFCFTCPLCGCQRTSIVQGEELVLDSLVLQEESSCPTSN